MDQCLHTLKVCRRAEFDFSAEMPWQAAAEFVAIVYYSR
jgi:hypothetical protein